MPQLTLIFLLLAAPAQGDKPFQIPPDARAQAVQVDPCAMAREIASQGPCLKPEDCAAYQAWKTVFGLPEAMPLDPEFVAQKGVSRASPSGARSRVRSGSPYFNCPAAAANGVASNNSLNRTPPVRLRQQ